MSTHHRLSSENNIHVAAIATASSASLGTASQGVIALKAPIVPDFFHSPSQLASPASSTPVDSFAIGAFAELAAAPRDRATVLNDAPTADFSMNSDAAALVADQGVKVDDSKAPAEAKAADSSAAAQAECVNPSADLTPSPADLKKLLNDSGVGLDHQSAAIKE